MIKHSEKPYIESIEIVGYIFGKIWLPPVECWKRIRYDVLDRQAQTVGKMALRDHVLAATCDGDFQSCRLAQAYLRVVIQSGKYRRIREWPLSLFPSIADMVDDEWLPDLDE